MAERRDPDLWARLRFAVVGRLLATPPEGRELQKVLRALSRQQWVHPVTGLAVSFAFSTIGKWFYQAKNSADPVAALRRKRRSDAGHERVFSPGVIATINALYAGYPGFSVQLHHDNLVAVSELERSIETQLVNEGGFALRPHNRWGGFKVLRERWIAHLDATHIRPTLIIDEAQEMPSPVLNELRLLTSDRFDSRSLLSVVLAGDGRLNAKLAREDLLPLGSRVRIRLALEQAGREALTQCLVHLMSEAGNANLMTPELVQTLSEHAMGNYRILTSTAAELPGAAAHAEITLLDEKLYLEYFSARGRKRKRPAP